MLVSLEHFMPSSDNWDYLQEGFFRGSSFTLEEKPITGKREESHAYQTLEEGRRATAVFFCFCLMCTWSVWDSTSLRFFCLGQLHFYLSMMHLSKSKRILFLNLSCAGRLPSLGSSFPVSESFLLFVGLLAIMKCLFICFWEYLLLLVKVPLPQGPVTIPYDAFNCCCVYHSCLYKCVVMKFCSQSCKSESCSDMPFIRTVFMFKVCVTVFLITFLL